MCQVLVRVCHDKTNPQSDTATAFSWYDDRSWRFIAPVRVVLPLQVWLCPHSLPFTVWLPKKSSLSIQFAKWAPYQVWPSVQLKKFRPSQTCPACTTGCFKLSAPRSVTDVLASNTSLRVRFDDGFEWMHTWNSKWLESHTGRCHEMGAFHHVPHTIRIFVQWNQGLVALVPAW